MTMPSSAISDNKLQTIIVSFIVVNWNGRHLLDDCIKSLLNQRCNYFEIILVDNGSVDGSASYIESKYPSVKVIPLKENRGFAGGNIEGLKYAQGEFIALINNDATIKEDWLETMMEAMSKDSTVGICASKIIVDGTDTIDSVGEIYSTAFMSLKVGEGEPANKFNSEMTLPGACAAAAIYRKKMLDAIGFLDDDYFLNYEDTDLHIRAWLSGWRCLFVPGARANHKVSSTLGDLSDGAVYYLSRNSEWVWMVNVPFYFMVRYLHQRMAAEFLTFLYICFIKNKWRSYFMGKLDAVKGIRKVLAKRKHVQKLVNLPKKQIKNELLPLRRYFHARINKLDFH